MKKNKYATILSVLSFDKERKNRGLVFLKAIFIIAFIIYIISSIIAVSISGDRLVGIFIRIGEILSIASSILISIIALCISASYSSQIIKLLDNIKEANEPLNLKLQTKEEKNSKVLVILIILDLVVSGSLFIASSVFQILDLFIIKDWITHICEILNLILTVFLIALNILAIFDCKQSSKQYKSRIIDIESINEQLFKNYNKEKVDKHRND